MTLARGHIDNLHSPRIHADTLGSGTTGAHSEEENEASILRAVERAIQAICCYVVRAPLPYKDEQWLVYLFPKCDVFNFIPSLNAYFKIAALLIFSTQATSYSNKTNE